MSDDPPIDAPPAPHGLRVTIDEIPHGGLHLVGESDPAWLGIAESGIRPDGATSHDLTVRLDADGLLVEGTIEAPFLLDCVRCLEPFPFRVQLDRYRTKIPTENRPIVDLTEWLREDILLALPGYPKCEQASPPGKTCAASGDFEGARNRPADEPGSRTPSGRSTDQVWDVLDDLKTGDE